MENLARKIMFIGFLILPFFTVLGCSSDDGDSSALSEKETGREEDAQESAPSIFEADIDLVDEDEQLEFKATGDRVQAMWGDIDFEGTTIPNLFVMELEDDNSAQKLVLLATGITGEGLYTLDKDDFEVAAFSMYLKDQQVQDLSEVYTFHKQTLEVDDQTYQSEVVLEITSLANGRVKGTIDIIMYSSVLEYEGVDDKKPVDGFVRKGMLKGKFDCVLEQP